MIKDKVKAKGRPLFQLFDGDMNLKAEWEVDNLITTVGKQYIAGKMDDSVDPTAMSHMAIGTGATTEVIGSRNGISESVESPHPW
jgi:hypothetical protein